MEVTERNDLMFTVYPWSSSRLEVNQASVLDAQRKCHRRFDVVLGFLESAHGVLPPAEARE